MFGTSGDLCAGQRALDLEEWSPRGWLCRQSVCDKRKCRSCSWGTWNWMPKESPEMERNVDLKWGRDLEEALLLTTGSAYVDAENEEKPKPWCQGERPRPWKTPAGEVWECTCQKWTGKETAVFWLPRTEFQPRLGVVSWALFLCLCFAANCFQSRNNCRVGISMPRGLRTLSL